MPIALITKFVAVAIVMSSWPAGVSGAAESTIEPSFATISAPDEPIRTGSDDTPARFTHQGLTTDQVNTVRWAVALYDEAGLELPPVRFIAHSTDQACFGRIGAAYARTDHTEIALCTEKSGTVLEFLLVHELAHAWDHHGLDAERRQPFLDLRGLDEWRGSDVEWNDRGTEQAAEIVLWGLMDRPVQLVRVETSCDALLEGYVTLTGQAPLHGYSDFCH